MRISDWSSDVCSSDLRQTEAAIRLELLDALHQPDIAFADQLADRQAIAAIAHGDLRDQSQVRGHELRRSFRILMFGIALREHIFLLEIGRASCRERVCQSV